MEISDIMAWLAASSASQVQALSHNQPETIREDSAPADAVTRPPFRPRKGTWFDEAIDFRNPEGEAVTQAVLALVATIEQRNRKRRQVDENNHYTIVRKILANGFRCHYHRSPAFVAYARRAESYRDSPEWLSGKAMARTVDLLARVGLLDASLGERGSPGGAGTTSTYRVTQALCEVARQHGVTESSLTHRLRPERLVRLRKSNYKGPLIAFAPTDDTSHWAALLEAYNAFIAQQNIALALSAEEEADWAKRLNSDRGRNGSRDGGRDRSGMPFYRPELIQTDLYRSFNNSCFEEGGRLYGGWWIGAPKALRGKITINGQPTVELDFSGCAPRMLYHERGLDYRDDPYRLEAMAAYEQKEGLKADHFREGIKAMMQALINDRDKGKPERIRLPDGLSFQPGFSRPDVRKIIEEKHAPIADAFGTGAGLRLQRIDSDLALRIVTELREAGIAALPIHDSFIVKSSFREQLKNKMIESYNKMLRFNPVIK